MLRIRAPYFASQQETESKVCDRSPTNIFPASPPTPKQFWMLRLPCHRTWRWPTSREREVLPRRRHVVRGWTLISEGAWKYWATNGRHSSSSQLSSQTRARNLSSQPLPRRGRFYQSENFKLLNKVFLKLLKAHLCVKSKVRATLKQCKGKDNHIKGEKE